MISLISCKNHYLHLPIFCLVDDLTHLTSVTASHFLSFKGINYACKLNTSIAQGVMKAVQTAYTHNSVPGAVIPAKSSKCHAETCFV